MLNHEGEGSLYVPLAQTGPASEEWCFGDLLSLEIEMQGFLCRDACPRPRPAQRKM